MSHEQDPLISTIDAYITSTALRLVQHEQSENTLGQRKLELILALFTYLQQKEQSVTPETLVVYQGLVALVGSQHGRDTQEFFTENLIGQALQTIFEANTSGPVLQ